MGLIDISQPVTIRTAHFPGDEPFSCGWTARLADGESANVGWLKTSPHVGTHVDAPYHFDDSGAAVGGLPLDAFVGACHVVDARGRAALDEALVEGLDLRAAPRVLFRTQEQASVEHFQAEFPVLTEGAVGVLRDAGVRLVGVDVPSVDKADAKQLRVHHALGRAGILNLENLLLDHAPAGRYELLAAPVRWMDMDGAPVRALLRPAAGL